MKTGSVAVGACAAIGRAPKLEEMLRALGEGPIVDLAQDLEVNNEVDRLSGMPVEEAIVYLWPRL